LFWSPAIRQRTRNFSPRLSASWQGRVTGVIGISCGPELTGEDVFRAGSVVATLPAGGGTVTISDTAETDAPLFVFDEAERLSDQQLGEICATIQRGAKQNAAGVLLAHRGFLARLEQPSLLFLREPLVLQLRFDEIGDDEGIDFLRHQLAFRHSQDETRHGRPILFRSFGRAGCARGARRRGLLGRASCQNTGCEDTG